MAVSLCVRINLFFQWDVTLLVAWAVLPDLQLLVNILIQEVILNHYGMDGGVYRKGFFSSAI